jgi:hypothetical protein
MFRAHSAEKPNRGLLSVENPFDHQSHCSLLVIRTWTIDRKHPDLWHSVRIVRVWHIGYCKMCAIFKRLNLQQISPNL